jgi:hypothetical protein
MDVGDILYFVIIAVGLIASYSNQNKKRKKYQDSTAEKSSEPIDLEREIEDFVRRTFSKKEETSTPQPTFNKNTTFSQSKQVSKNPKPDLFAEKQNQIKKDKAIRKKQQILKAKKESELIETIIIDQIDLKQAIIYQAILDRPQY